MVKKNLAKFFSLTLAVLMLLSSSVTVFASATGTEDLSKKSADNVLSYTGEVIDYTRDETTQVCTAEEALEIIENSAKSYFHEITIDEVLEDYSRKNPIEATSATQIKTGTYEKKMSTGTPGVSWTIVIDWEAKPNAQGQWRFSNVTRAVHGTEKDFWGTMWATAIIVTTKNSYWGYRDSNDAIIAYTDMDFEVWTQATSPWSVKYSEYHEHKFSTADAM